MSSGVRFERSMENIKSRCTEKRSCQVDLLTLHIGFNLDRVP